MIPVGEHNVDITVKKMSSAFNNIIIIIYTHTYIIKVLLSLLLFLLGEGGKVRASIQS